VRREGLLTPFLAVDLDRAEANVAAMLRLAGSPERWRPHLKTTKIPEIWDLLLAAGLRRCKCATLREAEVFLARSREPVDLLLAMPLRGPALAAAARLQARYPRHRLSLLVEDPAQARTATRLEPAPGLFLDLNPGMDRTGIPLADRERIAATVTAAGPALRGVHAYEGHLRERDTERRREACRQVLRAVLEVFREVQDRSREPLELTTSGTPTCAEALALQELAALPGPGHTVGAGTVVLWDGNSRGFGLPDFAPAAWVESRVVSRPAPGLCTCDAGSKALDCAGPAPWAEVDGRQDLAPVTFSEEHLVLRARDPDRLPEPGAVLRLLPAHVCPTVNLAAEAVLLRGGRVVAVVPVAARGHGIAWGEDS